MPMNIIHVGYDSTNYYVLGEPNTRMLVDVGFPGTLPKLLAQCKRKNIPFQEIRYLLVTHYHPDHAGLAQELKAKGVQLLVLEQQRVAIPALKAYMKPSYAYVDITLPDNLYMSMKESRGFLKRIGIRGEIIALPGHSDDSVALVLDEGTAFTGDLPMPAFIDESISDTVQQSWEALRRLGVRMIYPGHGPERPLAPTTAPAS